jgi:2'-5' RNA ligase
MSSRLFVAVWPSAEVRAILEQLDRPIGDRLRWTSPDEWHVTLRFLGDVDDDVVVHLVDSLRAELSGRSPTLARLGPVTMRLGPVLAVPVAGVEQLANAVTAATSDVVPATPDRSFVGHVTLARGRRRSAVPRGLAGVALHASWTVDRVTLVASHRTPRGPRYRILAGAELANRAGPGPGRPPESH